MIYRLIVERKLRHAFAALNRGDYAPILGSFAATAEHTFYGEHALGGSRHTPAAIRAWYARLRKMLPDLHFELDSVSVRGYPWRTTAMVAWRDRFRLPDGCVRSNQGVHVLQLRWGKVVSLRIHTDTQKLAEVARELLAQHVMEAGLAPITDAP
ncbi:MAG TPA: nuclear transport factor 2 family protein [Dokdonella sp.]